MGRTVFGQVRYNNAIAIDPALKLSLELNEKRNKLVCSKLGAKWADVVISKNKKVKKHFSSSKVNDFLDLDEMEEDKRVIVVVSTLSKRNFFVN
jgi:hypothetical protein